MVTFCQEKQYLPAQNVVIQEPQLEQSQQNQKKSVSDKRMRKQTFSTTILNATGLGAKWGAILGTIGGIITTISLGTFFLSTETTVGALNFIFLYLSIIALPASIIALTFIETGIGLFAGIGIAINNHFQEKRGVTVTS